MLEKRFGKLLNIHAETGHSPVVLAAYARMSEEQTVAIRRGEADFDPKLAALVGVVREIAGEVGEVDDATWQRGLE